MNIKKIAAFMTVVSSAAFAAAVAGTRLVISKHNNQNSINLNNVTNKQKAGSNKTMTNSENGTNPSCMNNNIELKNFSDDLLAAMINSFEKKMPYSAGHSKRVAEISMSIGEKLGFEDLEGLYYAAMLHDIGKVYMNADLLNKSKLNMNADEKKEWHNHPRAGADIVKRISKISRYANAVEHHHERFDGSGYPDGLKGNEIPIVSRIIEVADAFEAMSSERPGREAYPREYIVAELTKCSGTQFDPYVAKALMSVIADKYSK